VAHHVETHHRVTLEQEAVGPATQPAVEIDYEWLRHA